MSGARRRLTERRKSVGLSQEALAALLGVDVSTVKRWERGDTAPQPWLRPRLAKALRVTTDHVTSLLDADDHLAAAISPPISVSDGDDLIVTQAFRAADSQVGGGQLYVSVAGYLQERMAPRIFGLSAGSESESVFAAAATLTEMAGWMAHDGGRDELAEQHLRSALSLASVSQDQQLGAHICASLAYLAHHQRSPKRAIAYAQAGRTRLQGNPHRGVEARLLAMQARAHAVLGQSELCEQQLSSAQAVLTLSATEANSPWVSSFDEAALAGEAAKCFRTLGKLTAARIEAEQVVALRPTERVRSRAFAHLLLISVLLAEGKHEEACDLGTSVLASTRSLRSHVLVTQLEAMGQSLGKYRHHGPVRNFLDLLYFELRTRRWPIM